MVTGTPDVLRNLRRALNHHNPPRDTPVGRDLACMRRELNRRRRIHATIALALGYTIGRTWR